MAKANQNFTIYAGDAAQPIFSVVDSDCDPLDISGVANIIWNTQRSLTDPVLLTKQLNPDGTIEMIGDGSGGQFTVTLTDADTAPLTGSYLHQAIIVDDQGNRTTVSVGRMSVGRAPAWSYSDDPANSPRDAVRAFVGDIDAAYPLLYDSQIDLCLSTYGGPLYAAAGAARMIGAQFSGRVTKRVGDMTINYSDLAKQFFALADELQGQAQVHSGATVFAGGTSRSQMKANLLNPDRPKSPFWLWQFTNKGGYYGGLVPDNLGSLQ